MGAAHEHVAYLRGGLGPFRFIFAWAKESVIQDKIKYDPKSSVIMILALKSWHLAIDSA